MSLAQKYFRKAGIATRRKPVPESDVPEWLWRSAPDPEAEESADPADDKPSQGERSAKEVFHRLAGTWTYWGWKAGYFDSESDARAFYDELFAMLALQVAAPQLAAVVQHRAALGLWHRRPGPGSLLRRFSSRAR